MDASYLQAQPVGDVLDQVDGASGMDDLEGSDWARVVALSLLPTMGGYW